MYLSAEEISAHRNRSLSKLLGLSSAYLEAGLRLNNLFAAAGRDALHHASRQFLSAGHEQIDAMAHVPVNFWLEHSIRQSRLLDQASQIAGSAHKALLEGTASQLQIIDDMLLTGIRRGERSSPWEVELALGALRHSLETAEKSLHDITQAASDSVDRIEQDIHEVSVSLDTEKSRRKPTTSRTRARPA